jgi:hypothetical protein
LNDLSVSPKLCALHDILDECGIGSIPEEEEEEEEEENTSIRGRWERGDAKVSIPPRLMQNIILLMPMKEVWYHVS